MTDSSSPNLGAELWKVAVDAPLPTTFTYRAPLELTARPPE